MPTFTEVFGPDVKRWISYEQAGGLVGVDPRTIRRAVERGDVRARKFARRVRVDAQSLADAFEPVAVQ
ncbi:hypothetical protein ACWFOS_18840 [Gordonia terrae]